MSASNKVSAFLEILLVLLIVLILQVLFYI